MRIGLSCVLAAVSLLSLSGAASAGEISGDYVESRTADVYTGPCFANAQVGLDGRDATMAWRVRTGDWNGVSLDGLKVVAVVRASTTLGDPYHDPYPAKAVLIVDEGASEVQKQALVGFARSMGGRLLDNVVEVRTAPITMKVGEGRNHGEVAMNAGNLAVLRTRPINNGDHFCGNEITYYPPLADLTHAMPAYALDFEYSGSALGSEWKILGKRSAFVGTFSTAAGPPTSQVTSHH